MCGRIGARLLAISCSRPSVHGQMAIFLHFGQASERCSYPRCYYAVVLVGVRCFGGDACCCFVRRGGTSQTHSGAARPDVKSSAPLLCIHRLSFRDACASVGKAASVHAGALWDFLYSRALQVFHDLLRLRSVLRAWPVLHVSCSSRYVLVRFMESC